MADLCTLPVLYCLDVGEIANAYEGVRMELHVLIDALPPPLLVSVAALLRHLTCREALPGPSPALPVA